MPRGKPFICWLDHNGRHHDVPLYQGDSVMFRPKKRWILGTIHYGKGRYMFFHRSRKFCVILITDLKPVERQEYAK
jgi:hypothetical protein